MASRVVTKEIQANIDAAGVGSDENLLHPDGGDATKDDRPIVGELVIRMYADLTFDVDITKLGILGPGRLEQAYPLIQNRLMQAIAARDRESRGLPQHVNT